MTSNFEKEIFQQPEVIRNIIQTQTSQFEQLSDLLSESRPKFVLIAARGTSDNAAIYAKYLISSINNIPVGLAMPSLYTLYQQIPEMRDGLVIGISQSGQSPDVRAVLEEARRQGVQTLSITNSEDNPLTSIADQNIFVNAGEEKSVAASKTYTGQLTAIAMLVAYLSADQDRISELNQLGNYLEKALTQINATQIIAERFCKKNHIVIIGRGYNHCTTKEIALKIKELSYMVAQSYSAADFRHGPIAILENAFPVLAIAVRGKALRDMESLVKEIRWKDSDLALMTNAPWLEEFSETIIRLPQEMPEWLSPIVGSIPGQLLALHLALAKGIDPDKPRGLKKVTLTY